MTIGGVVTVPVDDAVLTVRQATLADAAWLLELRNDPATVAASRARAAVPEAAHAAWLALSLASRDRVLSVVDETFRSTGLARPVATYRLDVWDRVAVGNGDVPGTVELSLTVAPAHRGRGLAGHVVALGARAAVALGARRVVTYVRAENVRSFAAFVGQGFRPFGLDGRDCLWLDAVSEDIIWRAGGAAFELRGAWEGARNRGAPVGVSPGLSGGSTPPASTGGAGAA